MLLKNEDTKKQPLDLATIFTYNGMEFHLNIFQIELADTL